MKGRVAANPKLLSGRIFFTAGMSFAFFIAYTALAIGLAVVLTPFLKDWAVTADDMNVFLLSIPFRLLLAQFVFFGLSCAAGKLFKNTVRIDSVFDAWKFAWLPACVVICADIAATYFLIAFVEPHAVSTRADSQ